MKDSCIGLLYLVTACVLVLGTVTPSAAYVRYNGSPSCDDCHPGFVKRGPLHKDVHVGSQNMTSNCQLCHVSTGDNTELATSGVGLGCIGCHDGPGLRAHHANANVPPDANGQRCVDCHAGDPAPAPENEVPPHYARADVRVNNPCGSTGPGGEDWNGDGIGLDNDGDLLVDDADGDCVTPVEPSTWGRIKALYQST